jgi:hypothetical protein
MFASRAELVVYRILKDLQRESPVQNTIAVLPLPGPGSATLPCVPRTLS